MEVRKSFKRAVNFALSSQNADGCWDGPIFPTLFQSALVAYAFEHLEEKDWYKKLFSYVENYPVFKKTKNKYAERYLLHYEWIFHEGVRALVIKDEGKSIKIAGEIKKVLNKEGGEKIARKFLLLAVLFIQEGFLSWSDLPDKMLEKIKFLPSFTSELEKMPWRFVSYAVVSARYFYDEGEFDKAVFLIRKIIKYKSDNGSWNEYPFVTALVAAILNKMNVFIPDIESYFVSRQFDSGGIAPISAKIWDTAYAINSFRKIKGFNSYVSRGYSFLLRHRLPNGFWGWDVGGNMDFDTLSMVIKVLPYSSVKKLSSFLVANQKEEGGWGTWIKNDDSSVDVTAHCLSALGNNFDKSRELAVDYLIENNEKGAWFPSWYINVYYGISQSLDALMQNGLKEFPDSIKFIEKNQGKDGGWGELPGFKSSAVATSHAVLSLLKLGEVDKAREGVEWLVRNQTDEGTWAESLFAIGPYPINYSDFSIIHFSSLSAIHKFT